MKTDDATKKIFLLEQENKMLKKENDFLKELLKNMSVRPVQVNSPAPAIGPSVFPMYDRTKFMD